MSGLQATSNGLRSGGKRIPIAEIVCIVASRLATIKVMTSEKTTDSTSSTPVPPKGWRAWWDNFQILIIALVLALLIRTFVAEPRFIPSDSMAPSLAIGDRLVVEKVSYRLHPPKLGEIVVFDPPPQLQLQGYAKNQAFIKRVIGTAGQTIQVSRGQVYIDGQALKEPYIAEPPEYNWGPETVAPGNLFVMGDNRNNSNDSHVWGFLPEENIIGRAWLRFYPFSRIGRL